MTSRSSIPARPLRRRSGFPMFRCTASGRTRCCRSSTLGRSMKFGEIAVGDALGAILAHSVSHRDGVFKKGRVIGPQDVALLEASGVERVFAARLDVDDVPEDEAAAAVAQAIAGAGIEA